MKIEKISENKVKITLTIEELELRDISLADIEKDSHLARDLFIDILEESNLAEDFGSQDSQLFIEAASDNNNLFVITITKIDYIPELKKYAKLDNEKKLKIYSETNSDMIHTGVFLFTSLDKLLNLCETIKDGNIFLGRNSLYKYNNSYYVVFNDTTTKNKKFLKTFSIFSEYCDEYYTYDIYKTCVKEKANAVIEKFAIQKLIKKVIQN